MLLAPVYCQIKPLPVSPPTEINFQFLQGNEPLSAKGLVFQFRLLDSTGCALAVFQSPTDIELVSDSKIKVLVSDERVAHLAPKTYQYELVDVKGDGERLWQKGTFNIKNNVGAASSVVAQQNGRTARTDEGPFISLLRREVDPTVPAHVKAISAQQIDKWDKNNSPILTETDPTVAVHVKAITTTQIASWDQAAKNTTAPVGGSAAVYQSDYANNANGVVALNGSANIQRQNGQLAVSNISNGAIIGFGDAAKFRESQLLSVYVDFVKTSGDVAVAARFGNPYSYLLTKTGKYLFTISRTGTYPLGDFNVVVFQPIGSTNSFSINTMTITDGGAGFDVNTPFVKIGNGAKGDFNSVVIGKEANYAGNFRDGIVVGTNAKTDQQGSVVIGAEASGNWDNTYGCAGGNDQTILGYAGRGYGWRTTALGAWSAAGGQSSTAIGAGAVSLTSHSVAIGRGAFAANVPGLSGILTTDVRKLYLGNSYAHRFPKHPLNDTDYGVDNGDNTNPASVEIEIHGQDAYDARPTPTDLNRSAGHLGLYAGRGTGTGAGGEVRFYTAPTKTNTPANEKNEAIPAAKFDASAVPADGTRFWLYDVQSGALKRVKLTPPDAQGRKMLFVEN
ncbi:MAG: hypothetical protein EAZ32_18705 [Cytophagia bacterium]|nr:MAG: hypothetical protein EAZ38_01350 [Cytophagales bacterium]TAG35196.1 MAG: hypothetical protein EAZ32_18705 [Cytophagia bacterium]TAG77128.1 MAG: hypothetical protein EAZ22_16380 [Cytophagales bacterium]